MNTVNNVNTALSSVYSIPLENYKYLKYFIVYSFKIITIHLKILKASYKI